MKEETRCRTTRPRSLFCVVAHRHRDLALAADVCRGRFRLNGTAVEMPVPPDWNAAELPKDEEWRIQWRKFYYGLDLAHAYRETGEERFLTVWKELVLSFIDQVAVGSDSSDVAGRRIQNWIYAWDRFASSPTFTGLGGGAEERILKSLRRQVRFVRTHLTRARNHRTLELTALFNAAAALPDLDGDGSLLAFAVAELHRNLLADVLDDGVHRERSTHYHMIALRNFLGVATNARRLAIELPAGFEERLEKACEFALHVHRPDGDIPAFSDADTGSYLDLLELAAELFERADFLYAASGGRRGTAPPRACASFRAGGYYVQRSAWAEPGEAPARARYLLFSCGALGAGGHGHYDALHFEAAAGGRPLVIDPGRYTYASGKPDWRRWFKSTAAHYTVSVDGLDQTPYRRGAPWPLTAARTRLRVRSTAPGLDLLDGEVRSHCYDAVHRRRILFVAGEYWILEDRLRGDREHAYDLRLHLAPEAQGRTTLERFAGGSRITAPGLALCFLDAPEPRLEPGWFAPEYGTRHPAPVVSLKVDGVARARFVTLLAPVSKNGATVRPELRCDDGGATRLEIAGAGDDGAARDLVVFGAAETTFTLGPWRLAARAAWLRLSPAGTVLEFAACGATEIAGATAPRRGFSGRRALHWDRARQTILVADEAAAPENRQPRQARHGHLEGFDAL